MTLFDGFTTTRVDVDGVALHVRLGGPEDGEPLLLVHGYPETGAMWHLVAPALAETRRVVVPDLRGYGASARPASDATHAAYSKRATAADLAGLMATLGHAAYDVVGHDRGARVTHRMALDHPSAVRRAAVLDIAPTRHVFADVDETVALTYDHWFFLAQENDLPETLIGSHAEHWLRTKLAQWSGPGAEFDERAVAEYVAGFDAESVHATTEDYRAGATIDLEHDDASYAAGERVTQPLLVLWGEQGLVGRRYDVLDVWRDYATGPVSGHAVSGAHFLPEEAPQETLVAVQEWLALD
jgi:haloacetate dehalogenase